MTVADHTEMTRSELGDETVVAAVPIAHPSYQKWAVIGGAGFFIGTLLPSPFDATFFIVVGFFTLVLLGRQYLREPVRIRAAFGTVMAVFFPDRLELHGLSHGLTWNRWNPKPKRLTGLLATASLSGVSYVRTPMGIDTRLRFDGTEYTVHGWYERDLRQAIGPLGVELERLPAALPEPTDRNRIR